MTSVQANLRIDIAGGTLDLWPLYNFVSGAKTINCAISLKTQCDFELVQGAQHIHVEVTNLNFSKTYKDLDQFLSSKDNELNLIRPVFQFYKIETGFKIKIMSDSPVGGGLGGSSTLMISILKAVDKELGMSRSEESYVNFAANLESQILGVPAGTQDYYQALNPGLSVISYQSDVRKREFLKSPWLEKNKDNFLLIYSGVQHHSGLNNWSIFRKCVEKDSQVLSIIKDLKKNSEHILEELLKPIEGSGEGSGEGSDSRISELLNEELQLRRGLATGFVNEALEVIIKDLSNNGVESLKICGAGGGGCLWAIVSPQQRPSVLEALHSHHSMKALDCELVL